MIIACLNFYNELPALKASLPTYYDKVDKIIAVDGAYAGYPTNTPYSTDGSVEFLEPLSKVTLVKTKEFWKDQCVKRSEYFSHGAPGDLFFIIDADEFVEEFNLSGFDSDVGQVELRSPLYPQPYTEPRIITWMDGLKYIGRHHYIYSNEDLVASHRTIGPGIDSTIAGIKILHKRGFGKTAEQKRDKKKMRHHQNGIEKIDQSEINKQPVNIAMFTSYDPAGIAWGLCEAINSTTPNTVNYFRQTDNYIGYQEQHNTHKRMELAKECIRSADVIHCHQSLNFADAIAPNPTAIYVIHHHGTLFRKRHKEIYTAAKRRNAIQIVSNLELTQYEKDLHYLENLVPFARYNNMRKNRRENELAKVSPDGVFRIAHSPTSRENKGTRIFLQAVKNLQEKGLSIEAILIEKKSHKEALAMKVNADACFDSFWLGLQVSGLEAACFEQPVLAGDEIVRDKMIELYGACPYTFVTEETLAGKIEKLIVSKKFYAQEQKRVTAHVKQYHDYGPVAKKYLEIILDK